MSLMKAQVFVTLRKEVLDPQGKAVANALRTAGFDEVSDVRVGKFLEITLQGDRADAEARVREMSEKILSNPVIEDFWVELSKEA